MKYREISEKLEPGNRRKEVLEVYGKKIEKGETFGNLKGGEVKKLGGKKGLLLVKKEIDIWKELGVDVQKKICKYKVENDELVRKELFDSKGKVLIHPAMRVSESKLKDCFWEGRGIHTSDGVFTNVVLGGNVLGKLWMEIRDEL